MLFVIVAALLTAAASLAVLLPLAGRRAGALADAAHDAEVYRDQLEELARDAGRGLIGTAEAQEARAEIGRRLLKLDVGGTAPIDANSSRLARGVGVAAVLAVPLISFGLYAALGSPALPGQPLQARLAESPDQSSIDDLVARAEAHLANAPEDGRGWDVLAPIYVRMQRHADAVNAYRNAIRLVGETAGPAETAERLAGLGEALAGTTGGQVTAAAAETFRQALAVDAGNAKARFFLAVAQAQAGRLKEAKAAWQEMAAALPDESPWRGAATEAIAEVDRRQAAASDAPGPSAEEVDAASNMSDTDRSAMIETMVAGLDEKLRANPQDVEGWQRLVRSYVVLGRADDARAALDRGLKALDGASAGGRRLAELGQSLGLTEVR